MSHAMLYFAPTAAGLGDGSSWANRAALFDGSGAWSTLITGFDFSANRLMCMIGPGTYTCDQQLASASFTVAAPSNAKTLTLHACDSSGNQWEPPDPSWTSAQPAWDDSGMPYILCTTNKYILNNAPGVFCRGIKFQSASSASVIFNAIGLDWCIIISNSSGAGSNCVGNSSTTRMTNCVVRAIGSTWSYLFTISGTSDNIRGEGNPSGGGAGSLGGIYTSASNAQSGSRITIVDCPGGGIVLTNVNTALRLTDVIIANCGPGISLAYTGSGYSTLQDAIIVNNSGVGLTVSTGTVLVENCRLRNNSGGNLSLGNDYPVDHYVNETAGTDANEFVDYASRDLRIKNTSSIWGKGYGVEDEDAASGGGGGSGFPLSRIVN